MHLVKGEFYSFANPLACVRVYLDKRKLIERAGLVTFLVPFCSVSHNSVIPQDSICRGILFFPCVIEQKSNWRCNFRNSNRMVTRFLSRETLKH